MVSGNKWDKILNDLSDDEDNEPSVYAKQNPGDDAIRKRIMTGLRRHCGEVGLLPEWERGLAHMMLVCGNHNQYYLINNQMLSLTNETGTKAKISNTVSTHFDHQSWSSLLMTLNGGPNTS